MPTRGKQGGSGRPYALAAVSTRGSNLRPGSVFEGHHHKEGSIGNVVRLREGPGVQEVDVRRAGLLVVFLGDSHTLLEEVRTNKAGSASSRGSASASACWGMPSACPGAMDLALAPQHALLQDLHLDTHERCRLFDKSTGAVSMPLVIS
jgi:hypothetical protein